KSITVVLQKASKLKLYRLVTLLNILAEKKVSRSIILSRGLSAKYDEYRDTSIPYREKHLYTDTKRGIGGVNISNTRNLLGSSDPIDTL
ncbi:hypothetical protein N7516_005326, partial [Penicillium verrucosum]|uniref:uncharacterized protein n=1 Tax=Penicillium verrucosum TaxID=60171 RepID=UPI0025450BAF